MASILVIDDDEVLREFVANALRAAGHSVTMFADARIALPIAVAHPPDLVVSDINMPGLSGFEFAEKLNADGSRRWVPVILMSSLDDKASFRRAFGVGAIDYMVKPFSREELQKVVAKKLLEVEQRQGGDLDTLPHSRDDPPAGMPAVAGYTLLSPLGEGGMGSVFLAVRKKDGLRCALKLLTLIEEGREQTDLISRFLEERALLARINHPDVAKVYEHGITDNYLFIAMEYFSCGNLREALAHGVSVATALRYTRQIAEGLATIHAAGIVHRDVKPANIMVRDDGALALVDFGIAKELSGHETLTQNGELLGTPHYMSPEQIKSEPLDARSDLYSLGALLYEMLTDQKLFSSPRLESVLFQHLHAERPRLPNELSILQPLLDRLLAVRPEDRFADANEFLRNLAVVEMMEFSDSVDGSGKSFTGIADMDTLPRM